MVVKNYNEVLEELINLLVQYDKDCKKYETDVYLYYDEDKQTAELSEFVNVGGNSWLDDDHITIYRDEVHFDDQYDFFPEIDQFANELDISVEQLIAETAAWKELEPDEVEEVDWYDVRDYIKSRDDYDSRIIAAYEGYIDDNRPDYVEKVKEILSVNEIEGI